jgi:hypothetical protein
VVDPFQLLDYPVEPLQQGIDLAVAKIAAVHGRDSTRPTR